MIHKIICVGSINEGDHTLLDYLIQSEENGDERTNS